VCRSDDPRDRRTRSAAVIEAGGSRLLIDTPPELRLQLLAAAIGQVDGVLYTHEHADHINGIDDLRIFTNRAPLTVYGPSETLERLRTSFNYIFDATVQPYAGTSKPELVPAVLEPGRAVTIAGVDVLPLAFEHGHVRVFGYRFGPVAYITDAKRISAEARRALQGVEVLVLNALWRRPHPTHLSIDEAVETAQAIGARRTLLTHLTHETGHAELAASLPAGIEPAYDGLIVEAA
jgi:phosphoribosyl 1,2-cyclic phosphate phosphodiesterase